MASTKPELWEIVINDKIASQAQNQADADYIAFFRVKDKELEESIVTHFAKVKSINSNASITDYLEKYPQVSELAQREGKKWNQNYKEYKLEEIKPLPNQIKCRKGEGKRCQRNFHTTLEELNKASYFGDIKTLSQLKKEMSSTKPN